MVLFTLLQNRVVLFPTSEPHGPLSIYLLQSLVVLPFTSELHGLSFPPNLVVLPTTLKPRGLSFTSEPHGLSFTSEPHGLFFFMAAGPRFKSQCPSSFAAPFLTPPTVSYTCQHPCILPALLGCHSKSGQVWPHGLEPIISKLSRRPCNQVELLPSSTLGGSHSHLPGSKQGHSYLTYP